MTGKHCEAILLYYKYVDLASHQQDVKDWYLNVCREPELRGRVRVAKDGVNCTLGGSLGALREHIRAVRSHELFGDDIDFKLAASDGAASDQAALETSFFALTVSVCEEVVSLGVRGSLNSAKLQQSAAPHASPRHFHEMLAKAEEDSDMGTLLLDVRNHYETRIGSFQAEGVKLLDPHLRCFRDLASWLDSHAAELAGRKVLMYCTGGVRCERASAYLRSKGPAFQDVVQLHGGIQRYMEAFPTGGFFVGRNFVFDERVTVGSPGSQSVGRCLACSAPHDTYEPRRRCQHCRMLVLICPTCAAKDADGALLCELCMERGVKAAPSRLELAQPNLRSSQQQLHLSRRPEEHGNDAQSTTQPGTEDLLRPCTSDQTLVIRCVRTASQGAIASAGMGRAAKSRKLRILCLHGFRQSGSSLKGRTAALARKLADLAELTYVDAPHPLPFVLKPPSSRPCCSPVKAASGCTDCLEQTLQSSKRGQQQQQQQRTGRDQCQTGAFSMPAAVCHGGVNELPDSLADIGTQRISAQQNGAGCPSGRAPNSASVSTSEGGTCHPRVSGEAEQKGAGPPGLQMPTERKRFRRAWLLEPGQLPTSQALAQGVDSASRDDFSPVLDCAQHLRQTHGWDTSWKVLQSILRDSGPFDGIMGFSQGASVAAAVCALQQVKMGTAGDSEVDPTHGRLRFAICCSGYPSPVPKHQQFQESVGSIELPSLHVYGVSNEDRQVSAQESRALAELFDVKQRYVVEHSSGHIIPCNRAMINRIRCFLERHMAAHSC